MNKNSTFLNAQSTKTNYAKSHNQTQEDTNVKFQDKKFILSFMLKLEDENNHLHSKI